jgi:hypothetical protein
MAEGMCPPCSAAWMAWLDWTPPPAPIRLISIGNRVREALDRREARSRQWRETVRFHQDLIERQCAEAGHCAEPPPRAVERVAVAGGLL